MRARYSALCLLLAWSEPYAVPAVCDDIVDRGAADDGITTVNVLEPEADCTDARFTGWRCTTLMSEGNNNGVAYEIEVAWNLVGQAPRASFVWLRGNGGVAFLRNLQFAEQAQDELESVHNIRTVETRYLNRDGYHAFPSNGATNIAAVYADVLEYLVSSGIMGGVRGHVGNSGGSQLAADALAFHDAERLLNGAVLSGGPVFADLEASCTDVASPLFGSDQQRGRVDEINYRDLGSEPCIVSDPSPDPPYECRSTVGPEVATAFPNQSIHLVIGINESTWITATSQHYFDNISAGTLSYEQPNAAHNVFETEAGASAVVDRVVEIADKFGRVTLDVVGACGSELTLTVAGAAPNAQVGIFASRNAAAMSLPENFNCPGTWLGLGAPARIITAGRANAVGELLRNVVIPCGFSLQALELGSCLVSNVVQPN